MLEKNPKNNSLGLWWRRTEATLRSRVLRQRETSIWTLSDRYESGDKRGNPRMKEEANEIRTLSGTEQHDHQTTQVQSGAFSSQWKLGTSMGLRSYMNGLLMIDSGDRSTHPILG